ncbi:Cyclin-K isoform 3 [Schistosoma japonicum]|uniref:Cyclin-K isoform 3 n=1 Tax=Schistosoma japonicum TaxID=6182 RepID=A0A4Z2DSU3_SCHJA|nr:Cyclin-K isoform 3 [Schistosoma japonicum]
MPTCFWQVTAACCLMLAGKVEETPKKVRDIVKTARSLLSDADFEQFGSDPREEVMAFERVLLKTIKFDLQVSHPYSYLLQFAKRIKGNQEKLKELVQMSWSFINDSLATTLCLQWEPEIVACAVLYLATRMSKFTIEDWEGRQPGQRWWECFVEGMSTEVMEDICHKILDLYPADGNTDDEKVGSTTATTANTTVTNNNNNNVSRREQLIHHPLHSTSSHGSYKYQGMNSKGEPPTKRQALMRPSGNNDYVYASTMHTGPVSSSSSSSSNNISAPMIHDKTTVMKHIPCPPHYRLPPGAIVNNNKPTVYK